MQNLPSSSPALLASETVSQGLSDALWPVLPPVPCPLWQNCCGSGHLVPVLAFHNDVNHHRPSPSCIQTLLFEEKKKKETPNKKHHLFTSPSPPLWWSRRQSKYIFSRSEPSWGEVTASPSPSGKTEPVGWPVPHRRSRAAGMRQPHGHSADRAGSGLKVYPLGGWSAWFFVW